MIVVAFLDGPLAGQERRLEAPRDELLLTAPYAVPVVMFDDGAETEYPTAGYRVARYEIAGRVGDLQRTDAQLAYRFAGWHPGVPYVEREPEPESLHRQAVELCAWVEDVAGRKLTPAERGQLYLLVDEAAEDGET